MTRPSPLPPVMILCGGRGTRLREQTEMIPKPLVEIGGRPILWHIMKMYAHFGCVRFILCLGYKGGLIRGFFTREAPERSVGAEAGAPGPDETIRYVEAGEEWLITFAETGLDTNTGGRVKRAAEHVQESPFFVTYGDGLARIDLLDLLRFHQGEGRLATLTCVRPPSPFGIVELGADGRAVAFREKPRMREWVNGGFFVFERQVLSYLGTDDVLEREPFERLVKDQQLSAYRFEDFWMCMDTYKDAQQLNELWENGGAPWKVW